MLVVFVAGLVLLLVPRARELLGLNAPRAGRDVR